MKLLGKDGLLNDVKRVLRYSDWSGGVPFQWNETTNQLEKKTQKKLLIFGIRLGFAIFYTTLEFFQVFNVINGASLMVITHSILYVAIASLILSCQLTNFIKLSGVVNIFNGFVQLEQYFATHFQTTKLEFKRKSIKTFWFLRGLIYFLACTSCTYPALYALDILRNPCFPAYAGYWMSPQCEYNKPGYYRDPTWSLIEVLTKSGQSLTAYLIWGPLGAGLFCEMTLEYVVEGHCFRVSMEEFENVLLKTNYDNNRDLRKLALYYRQLQILSTNYRSIFSQFQIGSAIPFLIAIQTACLHNSIALVSGKDTGGPVWYNLLYVWSEAAVFCLIIFVFGILADVHTVSMKVQENINGRAELKKNKWFRRWVKSCPVLKIYFGGSNFLDRLTPLAVQDFAIDQTVSLMLVQN